MNTILKISEAIKAMVLIDEVDVYPLAVTNNTQYPYIVYKRDSSLPLSTKDGRYSNECNMSFNVYSDNYDSSIDVADELLNLLKCGTYNDLIINKIEILDVSEDFAEDTFIQTINTKIYFK